MMLIVAATRHELAAALDLCPSRQASRHHGLVFWEGLLGAIPCSFLRTGIGPDRAARTLDMLLSGAAPSAILVTGYAGALAPSLELGDLIVGSRASMLGEGGTIAGGCSLHGAETLAGSIKRAGLQAHTGELLTSPRPILRGAERLRLHAASGATAVDMETAALARLASERAIPLMCVRAISDTARGNPLCHLARFRAAAALAHRNLRRFFAAHFHLDGGI